MTINLLNMKELPDVLTKEETIHLFKNFTPINREKLILGHLRLAAFEAYSFNNSFIDKNEIFEIGIIGLIKAVDNFDVTMGISFSTFAKKCIDNQIITFLSNKKNEIKTISINEPIKNTTIEHVLTDNKLFTNEIDNKNLINSLLDGFNEKHRQIIILYFGLFGNEPLGELEIAKKLNMTRSGISYVIVNALKRMKKKLSIEEKHLNLK